MITEANNNNPSQPKQPQRIVFELFSHLYPQLNEHFRQLFTGEHMFGWKFATAQKLTPDQLTFQVVGELANYTAQNFTPIIGANKPQQLGQYSLVISPSKLKLGNYFEFKINLSPPTTTTTMNTHNLSNANDDQIVIGQVIDGTTLFPTIQLIKTNPTTQEPLKTIQVVECGQL